MRVYKRIGIICLMLLTGLSCAACGRKKVDYDVGEESNTGAKEESTAPVTEQNGDSTASKFANTKKWTEEIDVESEETMVSKVNISAEVIVPDTDSLSVVSVKCMDFDNEKKKELSDRLFDSERIYVYGLEAPTRDYLEAQINSLEEDVIPYIQNELEEIRGQAGYESYSLELESQLEYYQNQLDEYKALLETASEDWEKETTDFHEKEFLGEKDGVKYVLTFEDFSSSYEPSYVIPEIYPRQICFMPQNLYEFVPEELKESEGLYMSEDGAFGGANQCSLTEEDAVLAAEEFLDYLGFSDMSYSDTAPLTWSESLDGGTSINDGYSLSFIRKINGVDCSEFGIGDNYILMNTNGDGIGLANDYGSKIIVRINDKGIVGFVYYYPMEQTNVTEHVVILPFENIQEIIRDMLSQNFDQCFSSLAYISSSFGYSFNKMELRYIRVKDSSAEGEYSFIPVWQLSKMIGAGDTERAELALIINAIDGSRIDINKEIYDITEE